jgi:hypothetical protein
VLGLVAPGEAEAIVTGDKDRFLRSIWRVPVSVSLSKPPWLSGGWIAGSATIRL